MSGFDLVPVDGGAPVHLPPGETVLGRAPLLGVQTPRAAGEPERTAAPQTTHVNPCFVQSSPDDEDPRSLKKDSWYTLHHGDFISLLPGQFVYEVVAVGGDERTLRTVRGLRKKSGNFLVLLSLMWNQPIQ
ncbi:hypothetical protein INR49_020872 [Caranx melampygus]|nr:hypothetical protein INR49_020872 [Caranx melampygus]